MSHVNKHQLFQKINEESKIAMCQYLKKSEVFEIKIHQLEPEKGNKSKLK